MKQPLTGPAVTSLFIGVLLLLAACGEDKDRTLPSGMVPDFELEDVNPNSASFEMPVSPRQQLQKASAWYFGHAT